MEEQMAWEENNSAPQEVVEERATVDALLSPLLNPLEGPTMQSCGKLGLGARSRLPALERGRGSCQKSRDQTRKRDQIILLESTSKTNHKGLVSIREHPWVLGQATGTLDYKTHHGPDSREATTFPHIVYSVALRAEATSKWFFFLGLPSWSPEIVPVGVSGLWELITPDYKVRSRRGLNQSYSSPREFFNAVSYSRIEHQKKVDS